MQRGKWSLLCLLALVHPEASVAQAQAPGKLRSAAGASKFIQDMLPADQRRRDLGQDSREVPRSTA